jgi:DNA-directed RNA polymerase specialized sigma subunit
MPTDAPKKVRGYLATPLSREEQRRVGRLYREHGGLVHHMGRKMCRKFPAVQREDVFSCIDIAFIKTCRAWDPAKGRFSTLFGVFCEGGIRNFIRDHNWMIKAPGQVRSTGVKARYLLRSGTPADEVCAALNLTSETLRLALASVQSIDHETQDFRWHVCPRSTPWEVLEAEEG